MATAKVKGCYDVQGFESQKWVKLESMLRQVCRLYNYEEVRTPIIESTELFHRGIGDASDMVSKETYDFKDRGDRMITLRPEGTAGMARAYIENKTYASGMINKEFYIGQMFRYERPQKGRYRQFMQFGCECYGSSDPAMDAEVISLAVTVIKALGLKGIKVHINSLGDDESRDIYRQKLVEYFTPIISNLCSDCQARLEKNPLRILDCKVDKESVYFENAPIIRDYLNEASKEHFNSVLKYLDEMGIEYLIDNKLVRGLDYYTHTIFEIEADIPEFGAQNVLGGGGRYDNLIESLGGPKTPAVGFAFGMERLLLALEMMNRHIPVEDSIHLFVIALGCNAKHIAEPLLYKFREGGLICDMDYQGRNLKSQFKVADRYKARFIAILGDSEIENGVINLKDKADDTQITLPINELYQTIINKLNQHHCGSCGSCGGCGEEE